MTLRGVRVPDEKAAIREALLHTRLFADLPAAVIERFCDVSEIRTYRDGDCIAKFGDPSFGILVIAEGCIETSRTAANGKRMVLDYSQPGQVTGIYGTFDGLGFPLDNTARGLTRLVVIPGDLFVETVKKVPALAVALIDMFIRRGRIDFEHLLMAFDSMRVKVAKILFYIGRGPQPQTGKVDIPVKISQEDIAALIGASRQTINKELVALVREGILSWQHGSVAILDYPRLMKVALGEGPVSAGFQATILQRSTRHFPKSD